MVSDEISKNDPCPCGSGRQFHECCMGKSDEEIQKKRDMIESARRTADPKKVVAFLI